jgi:hypothetical protein
MQILLCLSILILPSVCLFVVVGNYQKSSLRRQREQLRQDFFRLKQSIS